MSREVEKISQGCSSFTMKEIHGLLTCFAMSVTNNSSRSSIANANEIQKKKQKKKKKKVVGGEYDSHNTRKEFHTATSMGLMDRMFTNHECLPSLDSAYEKFRQVYGTYGETHAVDEIREREYGHLRAKNEVCMDYCGFGLFSHTSSLSGSFRLAYISADLPSQALYGNAEPGTVESDIRNRIMRFMRTPEKDYRMVFSASRGSAFRLLGEYYPFHVNKRVLTVYDYESEGLNWMVESAKKKGAKHMSALFRWPSLRICSAELRKVLATKKKKKEASAKGLLVFPVQSRVTGAKYSFQWIIQAQQNGWHVLLDASALGPKDMDSLGLSLFLPDFIICSFYKVYGEDPTGFGCLFIRNSRISCLQTSSTGKEVGMVKIVPMSKMLSSSASLAAGVEGEEIQEVSCSQSGDANAGEMEDPEWGMKDRQLLTIRSFSGPIPALYKEFVPKEMGLNISKGAVMEADYFHRSDTESVTEADLGGEPRRVEHHQLGRSFDIPDPVLSEEGTDDDDGTLKNRVRGSEFEGGSQVHMEETAAWEQVHTEVVTVSEIQDSVSDSDFVHQIDTQGEGESRHLGHSRGSIPTEYPELENGRSWEPGESSGIDMEAPTVEEPVTKFTEFSGSPNSAVSHGGNKGKPWDGSMLQGEIESMESESSSGSGVLVRSEPLIFCSGLDHADFLGLNKTSSRLRHLINWLVNALLKLRHPSAKNGLRLVKIYGPKIKFDRGAAVAFNLFDWEGELVEPLIVQRLADRSNISLGYAVLQNIWCPKKHEDKMRRSEAKHTVSTTSDEHPKPEGKTPGIAVVTAALGFVTNFEDVYRLWVFVAKFLDADFVKKEWWRYRALNQQTIEV